VPFHQTQELQCLHHGATFVILGSPILSSQPFRVMIYGRHVMASVWDIKIAEALLILCLAYHVMKEVRHCWNWGVMAFTYWDIGHAFHEHIVRIFCNGWMDCRDAFHAVLCLYYCVTDRTYEVHWLIGVPIINPWGAHQPFFLVQRYVQINYVFKKVNNQV